MRILLMFLSVLFISACQAKETSIDVEVVASGLSSPWGLDFLDDGRMLVTEKPGRLSIVDNGVVTPISGVPAVDFRGQGGLLDVAVKGSWIYLSYAEASETYKSLNSTAVARGQLQGTKLINVSKIFTQAPKYNSGGHFGSRLVLTDDGHIFITLGDRQSRADDAQILSNHHGKVVRLKVNGDIPSDNPYVTSRSALHEIWSLGHRNVQGAALNPTTKELWTHEHGPQGGDEVNITRAAKNYGWPLLTFGEEYGGGQIGEGTTKPGYEDPIHYWVPSIAPSGMTFYTGDIFPNWKGDLFVGALKDKSLVHLEVEGNKIVKETRLLKAEINDRVRDVIEGPDGYLYVITDSSNGKILKIIPKI